MPGTNIDRNQLLINKVEQILHELADESVASENTVYLVDMDIKHGQGEEIISIFLDTDRGIDIDQCKNISRLIADTFESDPSVSERLTSKYRLEVSSPGLARPLKLVRQYKKNIGRLLQVKHKNEENKYQVIEGTLEKIDWLENQIKSLTLNITKVDKSRPNAKPKPPELVVIPFNQVVETKVKVSF